MPYPFRGVGGVLISLPWPVAHEPVCHTLTVTKYVTHSQYDARTIPLYLPSTERNRHLDGAKSLLCHRGPQV